MSQDDWVPCGAVMGVYGVQGWVRVRSDTAPPLALANYRPWRLVGGAKVLTIRPAAVREHGKGLVAKLADVDDREAAAALIGRDIEVPRAAMPAPATDEYYWHDLIGLEVVTVTGRPLGSIERLLETGAHDVLVIAGEDAEVLVPFVPGKTVVDVRLAERRVIVDWEWD